ncbi:MAG TPA: DUF6748 domain-containing protein [Kofleriaceae bacterium]|nr:DUF6748 domain-containing protein [Kofleriaceae bacterium]
MTSRILFALACTLPLTACLDSSSSTDELDQDDATAGDASKADAAGGTYTYYFVQQDQRRCASPMCGGVFYRLANATKTVCLDGKKADRCYAASSDLTKLGLDETNTTKVQDKLNYGEVLMRATIGSKAYPGVGTFAKLNAKEAWLPQGPNPVEGPIMKIEDSGIRCITFPCPSLNEKKLNSSVTQAIADLQWDHSGASERLVGTALDKLHTDGLIVSGYRTTVTGPAGQGKARSVTQLWFKQTNEPAAAKCFVGGCSGQVCSDDPNPFTTCEFQPEYACYHTATCAVQADGNCGWTQTAELSACLADPPN